MVQIRRQTGWLPGYDPIAIMMNSKLGEFCFMAKVCEVCGRGPQFGSRISHAHNVTKRRWNVNLQSVRALVNGAGKRLRVCASCIRAGKIQKVA
jgi:large subunit ribosomal protein L28